MKYRETFITRRRMLVAGSAVVAGGSTLLALDNLFPGTLPLPDSHAARAIGERYADSYPNPDELWRGEPPKSVALWGERLRELISKDFEESRMVQVDGWWLAETEVRLCVYIYLLNL